jgi:SNF2 family DNA or RNA helicase
MLRGVFGEALTLGSSAHERAWRIRQDRVDPALLKRSELTPDPGDDTPLLDALFDFQAASVQFMAVAGSGLLGDDMGLGKTIQILGLINAHHLLTGDGVPALVICPNSVKHQWVEAIERWLPQFTPYVVTGSAAQRKKALTTARDDPHAIVIINIESVRLYSRLAPYGSIKLKRCRECDPNYGDENLKASRCEVHLKELNFIPFKFVALDEAHRVKEPKSLQTRAIWYVGHQPSVKYRWGMTGTPVANHPGDLWSIMHFVAPDEYPTRGKYIDRFCLSAWNAQGTMDIVGVRPDTRDEFFRILDPRFRRTLKATVLTQLPPKIREVRYSTLSPAQRRMYQELSSSLVTRTPDGQLLLAPTQLAATTRLTQLAAASVKVEKPNPDDPATWQVHLVDPSPKLDVLEEVLDEIGVTHRHYTGAPVLIAAEHLQLLKLAVKRIERYGIRYGVISGEIAPVDRRRVLAELQAGTLRVLLFTSKAGGVGLNMTAADTLVNLQRSWSLVDEVQKEGRNYRIGSEIHESIRIIDIVSSDTIELDQITRLHEKFARLEEITRDRVALLRADPNASTFELDQLEELIMSTYLGLPSAT